MAPESRVFKVRPMTVMSSPVVGRFTKVKKALLTHGTTTGSSVLSLAQKATELVSRKPQSTEAEAED